MMLIPIIALIDDETQARLQPILDELTARADAWAGTWPEVQRRNGWTSEMLAWGLIIAAASKADLELAP